MDIKAIRKRTTRSVRARLKAMDRSRMGEWNEFLKKDEDFDYAYILKLLRYKLDRVRKHIVAHKVIKDAPRVSKEMREVIVILDRVINDRYEDKAVSEFRKRHGLKTIEKLSNELNSEYLEAISNARESRREDLKLAFGLMAENIWGWWD